MVCGLLSNIFLRNISSHLRLYNHAAINLGQQFTLSFKERMFKYFSSLRIQFNVV